MLYHLAELDLPSGSPDEAAALLKQSRAIAVEIADERLIAEIERLTSRQEVGDAGT
jgi:hypothetical protein